MRKSAQRVEWNNACVRAYVSAWHMSGHGTKRIGVRIHLGENYCDKLVGYYHYILLSLHLGVLEKLFGSMSGSILNSFYLEIVKNI